MLWQWSAGGSYVLAQTEAEGTSFRALWPWRSDVCMRPMLKSVMMGRTGALIESEAMSLLRL